MWSSKCYLNDIEEMRGLFRYDGKLNQFLTRIMYIVSLNLLFLLCSIPIFTIGTAYTAMYTVLFRLQEGDEPDILKTFFPVMSYYDNTMGGYLDFIVRMGILCKEDIPAE